MGKICQDLLGSRARGEILQHVIDGDAHPPNAGFTPAFARLKCYDVLTLHGINEAYSGE
jgi:hypothetical protein